MPPVTVPSVSATNLETYYLQVTSLHLHIIAWVFPQCKASQPFMKATGTQGTCQSGIVYKARSQGNQESVRFGTNL